MILGKSFTLVEWVEIGRSVRGFGEEMFWNFVGYCLSYIHDPIECFFVFSSMAKLGWLNVGGFYCWEPEFARSSIFKVIYIYNYLITNVTSFRIHSNSSINFSL